MLNYLKDKTVKLSLNCGDSVEIIAMEMTEDNFPSIMLKGVDGKLYYCDVKYVTDEAHV